MSAVESKVECPYCRGHVAFPTEMCGQVIECPHCRREIELPTPAPNTAIADEPLYRIRISTDEIGPYSPAGLRGLLADGVITLATPIVPANGGDWMPLGDLLPPDANSQSSSRPPPPPASKSLNVPAWISAQSSGSSTPSSRPPPPPTSSRPPPPPNASGMPTSSGRRPPPPTQSTTGSVSVPPSISSPSSTPPSTQPASIGTQAFGCFFLLCLLAVPFVIYEGFFSDKRSYDWFGPTSREVEFAFSQACLWRAREQYPNASLKIIEGATDSNGRGGMKITNRFKKTIDGETYHVVEFTIDGGRINAGLVKRGDSWYAMRVY